MWVGLKFIYSEKAIKFCEIFHLLLNTIHRVKSKRKILQNFVTFSEYMNFTSVSFYNFAKQIKFRFFAILNDMLCLQSGS